MADHVFPEDAGTGANQGDFLDAAPFASYVDAAGLTNFVSSGLNITLNPSTPSFDVSSGKAVVTNNSATGAQDNETYDDGVAFVAEVDSRSGLSLTDSAVNHVYLDVNLSSDDDITVTTNTSGSAPSEPSLKIAEIDTSSDTVTNFNRDVPINLSELSSQDHSSLTNVQSDQHHVKYTDKDAQNAVTGNVEVNNLLGNNGTQGQVLQTDGNNLSFADVSGGMTKTERQAFNDLVAQMARNDFADNLNEMAYDGGIFDVWRDRSKISSSSNVNIQPLSEGNSNGIAELKGNTIVTDNFESGSLTDGDPFTWTITEGTGGSVAIQQSTVKNGSNAVEIQGDGTDHARIQLNPSNTVENGDILSAWIQPSTINNDDADTRAGHLAISNASTFVFDDSVPDLLRLRFNLSSQSVEYYTADSSGTRITDGFVISGSDYSDKWYRLEIEIRPSQSEADFRIYDNTDSLLGETTNVSTSGQTDFSAAGVGVWNNSNDQCFVDDVRIDCNKGAKTFVSSGTVVSVSKDLSLEENGGFTSAPSSVVFSQKTTLPTDTDLQYVVRDGNGNTVTVAQSEVDTEVDTSNLTSTTVEVELQLSQSSTNNDVTPTSDDFMAHFKE